METTPVPDLATIKTRQQATWASGDFGRVGVTLQIVGESLAEAADIHAGERVLDVAAGNGNVSLAAARRFATVTSTDYVPDLLEQGKVRAAADKLDMTFEVADAENLPYADGSFDVVVSTFGVMFAPNSDSSSAELLRVTKSQGRIGLVSWTPEGFLGKLFGVVGKFVPPPAGLKSPMQWGNEARLQEMFGAGASSIQSTRKIFNFRYASAEHFVDFFRDFYGPTHKAFAALDDAKKKEFREALLALLTEWNRSTRGGLVVPGEYLETVITKK